VKKMGKKALPQAPSFGRRLGCIKPEETTRRPKHTLNKIYTRTVTRSLHLIENHPRLFSPIVGRKTASVRSPAGEVNSLR
jgi:hypothetical protein